MKERVWMMILTAFVLVLLGQTFRLSFIVHKYREQITLLERIQLVQAGKDEIVQAILNEVKNNREVRLGQGKNAVVIIQKPLEITTKGDVGITPQKYLSPDKKLEVTPSAK